LKQPKRPDVSPSRPYSRVWNLVQKWVPEAPRDAQTGLTTGLADLAADLARVQRPDRPSRKRRRRPLIDAEEWQYWESVFDVVNAMRKLVTEESRGTLAAVDAQAERALGAWSPETESFPLWPALVGALSLVARRSTDWSGNLTAFLPSERERAVKFLESAGQCTAPPWGDAFGVNVATLFRGRPDAVNRVRRCEHCGAFFLGRSAAFRTHPARACSPSHKVMIWRKRTRRPRRTLRPAVTSLRT
jgi:hypothetical protein